MKQALLIAFMIGMVVAPENAHSRASEPQYYLANHLSESIQVALLKENGDVVKRLTLLTGRDVNLHGIRRIVVYRTDQAPREYALPAVLDIPVAAGETDAYESVISGKWRLYVSDSPNLNIEYRGGAAVRLMPDFTKSPILFPLRPRSSNESFSQYRESLRRITRATLQK